MTRSAKSRKLPLPTASEAAFERLLESFDGTAQAPLDTRAKGAPLGVLRQAQDDNVRQAQDDTNEESIDAFVERMFAQQKKFLGRDAFAGIGERDTFPTKIMGVSFEGRQDIVAGIVPGVELQLE